MTDSSLREVHQPVLLEEAVEMLRVTPGGIYMDGTFGLGGHTKEILKRSAPDGRVVAFQVVVEPAEDRHPQFLRVLVPTVGILGQTALYDSAHVSRQ